MVACGVESWQSSDLRLANNNNKWPSSVANKQTVQRYKSTQVCWSLTNGQSKVKYICKIFYTNANCIHCTEEFGQKSAALEVKKCSRTMEQSLRELLILQESQTPVWTGCARAFAKQCIGGGFCQVLWPPSRFQNSRVGLRLHILRCICAAVQLRL